MRNIRAFESFVEDPNPGKRLFIVSVDFQRVLAYGVFLDYDQAQRYRQESIDRIFDIEQRLTKYVSKERIADEVYIEEFTADELGDIVEHIYTALKTGLEPADARKAFETVLDLGVEPSAVAGLIDPREVDHEKFVATFRGTPFWPFINRTNKSNRLFGI